MSASGSSEIGDGIAPRLGIPLREFYDTVSWVQKPTNTVLLFAHCWAWIFVHCRIPNITWFKTIDTTLKALMEGKRNYQISSTHRAYFLLIVQTTGKRLSLCYQIIEKSAGASRFSVTRACDGSNAVYPSVKWGKVDASSKVFADNLIVTQPTGMFILP